MSLKPQLPCLPERADTEPEMGRESKENPVMWFCSSESLHSYFSFMASGCSLHPEQW